MNPLQTVLDALDRLGCPVTVRGSDHRTGCPAHGNARTGTSLSVQEGNNGVIIHCFGGCDTSEVIAVLGLTWGDILGNEPRGGGALDGLDLPPVSGKGGLLPPPPGLIAATQRKPGMRLDRPEPSPETWVAPIPEDAPMIPAHVLDLDGRQPDRRWKFLDREGRPLWGTCRWDKTVSGKQYKPLTLWATESGQLIWRTKAPPKPRPIYGLHRLGGRPVLVCEGEKSADGAELVFPSYAAVGWHGGADAVKYQDWQPVKDELAAGQDIYLWPDADDSGRKAMKWLAQHLGTDALVDVPIDLPEGWDLADECPPGFDPAKALADAANIDTDWEYRKLLTEVLDHSPRFEDLRSRGLDVFLSVSVVTDARQCWLDTKDLDGWEKAYAVWRRDLNLHGTLPDQQLHTHWMPNGERLRMEFARCGQTDEFGDDDN